MVLKQPGRQSVGLRGVQIAAAVAWAGFAAVMQPAATSASGTHSVASSEAAL